VAGVKPKINCPQCGSVLADADPVCPSCGVTIDWSGSPVPAPMHISSQKILKGNKSQQKSSLSISSTQSIVGILIVVLLAVIAFELFTSNHSNQTSQQVSSQPMSAGQMPPEVAELIDKVKANPEDLTSVLQLANVLHDNQLYDMAIQYYQQYLEKNSKNADAHVDLGICYKELGKFAEAKSEMQKALKDVPKHIYAHFNLGIVCLSEGNLKEANEWFKKTVALDPASEVGTKAQQLLNQHKSQTTTKN
jgi:tetratricopeptide (TPR) repeat protein